LPYEPVYSCFCNSHRRWIVAGGTLLGQSRDELRRKYGDPVSETFLLRPGLRVTATYAANDRIVELLISPELRDYIKSPDLLLRKPMSQEFVRALIAELLPGSVRGKFVIGGFDNTVGCLTDVCGGSFGKYERPRSTTKPEMEALATPSSR
jgi:hypothetical protein